MENFSFTPKGICPKSIDFSLENDKVYNVCFHGGCPGNTSAISKLIDGMEAQQLISMLKGNQCGPRGTSCADQLVTAIEDAIAKKS